MIYMSGTTDEQRISIVVLDSANLEKLKKGLPARTPDGSIFIAWCPDLERLGKALVESPEAFVKLLEESAGWPEKPTDPDQEMVKVDYFPPKPEAGAP